MLSITIQNPATVTPTATVAGSDLKIAWSQPAITSYPIKEYDVYVNSVKVTTTASLSYTFTPGSANTLSVYIVTRDMAGNISANGPTVSTSVTVGNPTNTSQIINSNVLLSWTPGSSTFPIAYYNIYNGATLVASNISGTSYILSNQTTASYTYTIKAVDTSGNISSGSNISFTIANPGTATAVSSDIKGTNIVLSWVAPSIGSTQYPIKQYEIWYNGAVLATTPALTYTTPVLVGSSFSYYIVAVDVVGNRSANSSSTSQTVTISAPTLSYKVVNNSVILSWVNGSSTFPISTYEIRKGSVSWADITTTSVDTGIVGLTYTLTNVPVGTTVYRIKATDSIGNTTTDSTLSITLVNPSNGTFNTPTIINDTVNLTWTAPSVSTSQYPIKNYEIGYGNTSTVIAYPSGTAYSYTIPIGLSHNFYLTTVDVMGNRSTGTSVSLTITPPSAPVITSSVVDNNVLLYWTDTAQSLPIYTYEIHRGSSYAFPPNIGTKTGLFTTVFETQAGSFTYWITAVDVAGNKGTPRSSTVTVSQPPDYVLKVNQNSTLAGTLVNVFNDSLGLLGPTNNTEQFQQHFTTTTHGGVVTTAWSTPQDQITAGFPIYIQPNNSSGYYEETIDYGSILASSKITVTPTTTLVSGSPTINTDISISLDNTAWSTYSSSSSVFATNFRYVKYRLTINTALSTDLLRITNINITLDQKLKSDAGMTSCLSTDGGSGASATVTLSGGSITGFTGLVGGSGYSSVVPPSINITGNGTGAVITANVSGGAVTGFNILNAGTGYTTCTISISGAGTVVPWNSSVSFTDITAISVTPSGTSNVIALYDFADVPNPSGFRIILLNPSTGARVSGTASWNVKGY